MSEDFIKGDIVKQKSDVLERYSEVVERKRQTTRLG